MAAGIQVISILLGCLISEEHYATALPRDNTFLPPEGLQAPPGYYMLPAQPMPVWGHVKPAGNPTQVGVWQQPYGNVKRVGGPNQPGLYVPRSTSPVKPSADSKRTLEKPQPQAYFPQPKPRSFEFNLKVPALSTDDNKRPGRRPHVNRGEVDHSQLHRPSPPHFENHYNSPPKASSDRDFTNYPNKGPRDFPKPGFHLSLNVPVPPITSAPEPPRRGTNSEDAEEDSFDTEASPSRFYFPREGHEINKPVYPKRPEVRPFQKPTENKLETFFTGLLNLQRDPIDQSQVDTHKDHSQLVGKPGSAHHPTRPLPSGFPSGQQTPTNQWIGHTRLVSPTHAGSVVQRPVHHAAQSAVHYSPPWYHIPTQVDDNPDRIRNDVMQAVQNINGQLMIPIDKCPGFHYHRQDPNPFPASGQTPVKPHYPKFFVNMEGPEPEADGPNFGTYQRYPYRLPHPGASNPQASGPHSTRTEPTGGHFVNPLAHPAYVQKDHGTQHSNVRPGHTNYLVHFGRNVGHAKPSNPGHVQYFAPQTPRHAYN